MKKLFGYIKSALYNIRRNKLYALFCILGTALTFCFITFLLQFVQAIAGNNPPIVHADRIINISEFEDKNGQYLRGITIEQLQLFKESIRECEDMAIFASERINVFVQGTLHTMSLGFINAAYWDVMQFDFIEGRAFTEQEVIERIPLVVIKKILAKQYFGNRSAIGEFVEFQGNKYKIIGVVDNPSVLVGSELSVNMWAPYTFNKHIPSGNRQYNVNILFPEGMPVDRMKELVYNSVQNHYELMGKEVYFPKEQIYTIKEMRMSDYGGNLFAYGAAGVLLILLIVPAVNIVTLNVANITNRAEEIAIRRTMGATKIGAFVQLLLETLVLVLVGTLLGVAMIPGVEFLINTFFEKTSAGGGPFLSGISPIIIFLVVFPLSLLFTFLSGTIPAYMIAKRNIAEVLKGGSKW